MSDQPKTLAEAVGSMTVSTAVATVGLLVVAIGSIAPWVTTALSSTSGTVGDGKYTLIGAGIGLLLLLMRSPAPLALLAGLITAAGVYDTIHLHHKVQQVIAFGVQIAHVGWGVYAVTFGAAVVFFAALDNTLRRP